VGAGDQLRPGSVSGFSIKCYALHDRTFERTLLCLLIESSTYGQCRINIPVVVAICIHSIGGLPCHRINLVGLGSLSYLDWSLRLNLFLKLCV
jgi:hypothetical protein